MFAKKLKIEIVKNAIFTFLSDENGKYGVSLRIQSECGTNADQNNSEYEHFLSSAWHLSNIDI